MTRNTTPPWFESLTDSVHALGAAAREAQHAHHAARISLAHYDLDRLRAVDGELMVPGRPSGMPFRPHDHALFTIGDAHRRQANTLYRLFCQTADGYAYGTTWAIRQVLDGRQPPVVELRRSEQGFYVLPSEAHPSTEAFEALGRWAGKAEFDRALTELQRREAAAEYAEGLDAYEYLTDHEASAMHDAARIAEGRPDAAYAYGEHAERALRFALLGARSTSTSTTSR
ncbi:hypothetical protein [Streptomyces antimicrobicus]|uniref:Uncharacterized protein n=1 Tax=Streptomyces antimicrobicus TaxID=2883108 RepID=A0ABS8AZM2_9ACTN|nr:hypothetical protein [Streptomyces antimicrobicus]MCB5177802.1 hypothetical protein [Streptomyces antimicrobicus]